MQTALNRYSGLFFVALGLLLFFVVIPYATETVDQGWVRPQTVPNVTAWIMVMAGAAHAIRPAGEVDLQLRRVLYGALYLAIVATGVVLTAFFGFEFVAPVLALAIMVVTGERRAGWLVLGVLVIPASIWFAVVVLLDRPLP